MTALPQPEQPGSNPESTAPPAEDDRRLAVVDDMGAEEPTQLALFDADEYLAPLRYVPCHRAYDEDHDRARCWLCFGDRFL